MYEIKPKLLLIASTMTDMSNTSPKSVQSEVISDSFFSRLLRLDPKKVAKADPDEALRAYFAGAPARSYKKGEVIVQGDQPSEFVYFISSGYVKGYTISDDGSYSLLVIKGVNDLFPLVTLFDSSKSPVYYEAVTDMVVHRVSEPEFRVATEINSSLTLATLKKTLDIMRDYTQRMQNLTIADARTRIICRLLFLLDRFGASSKPGREVIFLPITYPDLADSLNLTRETVNRIVSRLATEGLLVKSHGRVTITDKQKLQAEIAGI